MWTNKVSQESSNERVSSFIGSRNAPIGVLSEGITHGI
jgi:hypothetical protein